MEPLDLHRVMNPVQYSMSEYNVSDEENIYFDYQSLKEIDVYDSMSQETFDKAESNFIVKYFGGNQDDYNEWKALLNFILDWIDKYYGNSEAEDPSYNVPLLAKDLLNHLKGGE